MLGVSASVEPVATTSRPEGRWAVGSLFVGGFAVCSLPVFLGIINHDVAWYLHVAGRVLAGDRLYRDIYEINPPLIAVLNFTPVILAKTSGISPVLALRLLMLGSIGVSLLTVRRVLREAMPDRPAGRREWLALSMFILLPLAGYDFAQREHIMLTCVLPYLTMAIGRAKGARFGGGIAVAVGLMAGVGLALKPHFGLLWMAIEVQLAWSRRDWRVWLRAESLIVVAFEMAYGAAVWVFVPEYREWVGRVMSVYAATNPISFGVLVREPAVGLSVLAGIGLAAMRPKGKGREARQFVLVANLSLLAIAIVQNKGYGYQFYPALAMAVMLIGLLSLEPTAGFDQSRRLASLALRGILAIALIKVATAGVAESMTWRGSPPRSDTPIGRMIRFVRDHAGGGEIFVFSPSLAASFPLVTYAETGWATGHPCLWFLPALRAEEARNPGPIAFPPISTLGKTERFLLETLICDLVRRKPTLLIVDEAGARRQFPGHGFDYLDYYSRDPRFAEFFRDYEVLPGLDDFRVYRRKGGSSFAARGVVAGPCNPIW